VGQGGASYRLQEAVQLQGLAEQPSPLAELCHKVVAEVLELLALRVNGVHSVVLAFDELLALQGQGSGPVHSHLRDTVTTQKVSSGLFLLEAKGKPNPIGHPRDGDGIALVHCYS
jgi:hypothetical protein